MQNTKDQRERVASWAKSSSQRAGEDAWDLYATEQDRGYYMDLVERWLDEEPRRRIYSNGEPPGQREHTKKLLAVSFWLTARGVINQKQQDDEWLLAWGEE